MAAKVGLASVSYGIGVQNRYSAFLDDEDGFGAPQAVAVVNNSLKQQHAVGKQKSLNAVQSSSKANSNNNSTLTAKTNGRVGPSNSNNKQDHQQQKSGQASDQQRRNDAQRRPRQAGQQQQQQQHSANSSSVQAPRQAASSKQGNNNQDNTANNSNNNSNNRFARTQLNYSNHHHQSQVSHQQQNSPNKENNDVAHHHHHQQQHQGKFARSNNNQRSGRRQYYNDDKKSLNQQVEDGHSNSFGTPIGVQSNEEEKRRRQQKRALDLKHKDPEKREARRSQQMATGEQLNAGNQPTDHAQGDANLGLKGHRNRRQVGDGGKNPDDATGRNFKGTGGGRSRARREQGAAETNGERREGPQVGGRNARAGDRPQRNRNGFGAGSRGSRGSRGDDQGKFGRDSERQKPIPNFSDKLDFPSLAS